MNIDYNFITKNTVIICLYFIISIFISPVSYGVIQFRISEILVLLPFIDKRYSIGIILGCLATNFFSPFGIIDMIFGTFATFLTVIMVSKSRSLFIASLWPTIFSIIISIQITLIQNIPILISSMQIMISEFIIVTIIGYPLFKIIIKNPKLYNMIKF
ncbi:MAG: QueT transporter family protein [Oscillospiraceae bacterium]|nr:QueT transporter family protein [Oscillospiraceae bacterium]